MKLRLLIFILLPYFSFAQDFIKTADSVRITRTIPGLAYAVFSSDKIIDEGAVGYKKFRTKDSLHVTDRFNIGTNTAAFTAYIAANLVEKGKIKWTTKLLDIFPEFRTKALPVFKNITLEALLSNKAQVALYSETDDWSRIPAFTGDIIAQRKAFTLFILQQKPFIAKPLSTKINFSVAGFVMAAAMLEKITGRTWEQLVTSYINIPLKVSVKYAWPNVIDSTATTGHWYQSNSFHAEERDTWLRLNPILYPAHDINISLTDYIKFMQENLKGLLGKKAALSQKTFEFLHFGIPDYSLGWYNGSIDNNSFSFSEGISLLFSSKAEIIKEKNLGIIVMSNSGDNDGRGGVLNLTQLLQAYYLSK